MTHWDYLNDTYLYESTGKITELGNENGTRFLVLDRTIFYPQGGGQPTDRGEIIGHRGTATVTQVRLEGTGTIKHYAEFIDGAFAVGDEVILKIDRTRRQLHARLHSAGHLVDAAVASFGDLALTPAKGYHFPEGPYVEFSGTLPDAESYLNRIQSSAQALINKKAAIHVDILTSREAEALGVHGPAGRAVRFVYIDGYKAIGCGCGGTHVRTTSEIGEFTVRKISSKKGVVRVSYQVGPTSFNG